MNTHDHDTLRAAAEQLAENIDSPDDLRFAVVETALACWEQSDQSNDSLTSLIGGLEAAKQVLFMHLGDRFNEE